VDEGHAAFHVDLDVAFHLMPREEG
jgi:hypothetical protein